MLCPNKFYFIDEKLNKCDVYSIDAGLTTSEKSDGCWNCLWKQQCHFKGGTITYKDIPTAKCDDCGMPYGGEDWVDTLVPHSQWKIISPENGILCANCIVKRASKLTNIRALKTELVFIDDEFIL